MTKMKRLIVSRHPAAVEFVRAECAEFADAAVVAAATPDDVRGAVVAGNLPLHLAALAAQIVAVEFDGEPPRGAEYGLPEMRAAGARLARYTVAAVDPPAVEIGFDDGRKPRVEPPIDQGREAKIEKARSDHGIVTPNP